MFTIKVSPSPGMEYFQDDGKLETEVGERMWVSIQDAVAEAKKAFASKPMPLYFFKSDDKSLVLALHPPSGKRLSNLPAINQALDIFAAQQKKLLDAGVDRLMKDRRIAKWLSEGKPPITRDKVLAKTRITDCYFMKGTVPSFEVGYMVSAGIFLNDSKDFSVGPFENGKLVSGENLNTEDIDELICNS